MSCESSIRSSLRTPGSGKLTRQQIDIAEVPRYAVPVGSRFQAIVPLVALSLERGNRRAACQPGTGVPDRACSVGTSNQTKLLDRARKLGPKLCDAVELAFPPVQPDDIAATTIKMNRLDRAVGCRSMPSPGESNGCFAGWQTGHCRVHQP